MSDDQEIRYVPISLAMRNAVDWTTAFPEIVAAWDAALPPARQTRKLLVDLQVSTADNLALKREVARLREALVRIEIDAVANHKGEDPHATVARLGDIATKVLGHESKDEARRGRMQTLRDPDVVEPSERMANIEERLGPAPGLREAYVRGSLPDGMPEEDET